MFTNFKTHWFFKPGNDKCGINFGIGGADVWVDETPNCGVEGAGKCNDEKCGEGVCAGINTGVGTGNTGVGVDKTGAGGGWAIDIVWAICDCCVEGIGEYYSVGPYW